MNYIYKESIHIDSLEIECEVLVKINKEPKPNEDVIEILDIQKAEAYNNFTCEDQYLNQIEMEIAKEYILEDLYLCIDDVIEQGNQVDADSFEEVY